VPKVINNMTFNTMLIDQPVEHLVRHSDREDEQHENESVKRDLKK